MRVSIAITIFNGARYLFEQLDSFVRRTRQPTELVVTEGCAWDEALALLRTLAETVEVRVVGQRLEPKKQDAPALRISGR